MINKFFMLKSFFGINMLLRALFCDIIIIGLNPVIGLGVLIIFLLVVAIGTKSESNDGSLILFLGGSLKLLIGGDSRTLGCERRDGRNSCCPSPVLACPLLPPKMSKVRNCLKPSAVGVSATLKSLKLRSPRERANASSQGEISLEPNTL